MHMWYPSDDVRLADKGLSSSVETRAPTQTCAVASAVASSRVLRNLRIVREGRKLQVHYEALFKLRG
eukprot:3536490-Amphidinium_carterae.1